MSSNLKTKYLKWLVAAAGLLAMMLRLALLQTGVDERGLLATGHWADTGSWLLTAATIGVIFFSLRHCTGPKTYDAVFPRSMLRCAGSLIAACSFLLSGTPVVTSVKLAAAEPVLRTLAAAALVAVSFCRFRGKKPSFLFHGTVCLYLALRMVCRYQIWSADPQLQHYAFYLGAHVALMLSCYQMTAFDADSGNYRSLWSWCLGAVYLCLAAIPASEDPFFLLCTAVWMLTCLCSSTPAEGD